MIFYTNPIPCIIIALMIGLHVLSEILRGRLALLVNVINICLHAALAAAELYLGASLGEITLLYATSLLLYLLLAVFLLKKKDDGAERREDRDL